MNKEKIIKICFILSPFILAFPFHFIYDFISFPPFSIYFPVNESIFEHTKLLFTPIIISFLIFYLIYRKKNINKQTYLSSLIISISISIISMLALYYLSQLIFNKEIMIVNIIILLIASILGQIVSMITYKKKISWSKEISIYALITMTLVFLLFTVNPPHLEFFYDKEKLGYGLYI